MDLSDFVLKTRVNLALVRDPRVGVLDIGVAADDGVVTLSGDVDTQEECDAASEIAESVDGVTRVFNTMTCGIGADADTAESLVQKLLQRLEDAWNELPDQNATTQADYVRWALWMVYKFRIPAGIKLENQGEILHEAAEKALTEVAGRIGAPKALMALEMLRQAEMIESSPNQAAPDIDAAPLVATPAATDEARAA